MAEATLLQTVCARAANRVRGNDYFAQFMNLNAAERDDDLALPFVGTFTGLSLQPTPAFDMDALVEAVAQRVVAMLEDGGYVKTFGKPKAPVRPLPVEKPRTVPTPAPKPITGSPRSLIETLTGETLYIRSLFYDPSKSLRDRWEAIVDDGGEHKNILVWLWEEDKRQIITAGYSTKIFESSITRRVLERPIPITIKWTDSNGAKLNEVLNRMDIAS
jgi:hypothetical protein